MHFSNQTTCITLYLLINALPIVAAAGTLDPSYGPNGTGIVTSAIGRQNTINCIAAQADNSIIGTGIVKIMESGSGICKFTSNGTLDTTFNGSGYAQLSIGTHTVLQCLALQPDGNAIVAGYTTTNDQTYFALARFTTNGSLDETFGSTGYVTTLVGTGGNINALCIQPDGKIIVGGTAVQDSVKFALARYNSDGSLDTTFGNSGIILTAINYMASCNALALQPDGKILATGFAWNGVANQCALARYNSDGSLDTNFGTQGITITSAGMSSQAQAIALTPAHNIIIAGSVTNNFIHYSFALLQYDTNGNLDSSFNNTGIVVTSIPYSGQIAALAVQADGNIIVGGSNFGALSTTCALARYLPSGILDATFGTNGITLTPIGSTAQINSIILQSDGKIIAAGYADNYAVLARYFA